MKDMGGGREARESTAEDGGYTPAPWHVGKHPGYATAVYDELGFAVAFTEMVLRQNREAAPANARRIVQCVNNFDALIDVAERVLETATEYTPIDLLAAATVALEQARQP